MNIVEYLNTDMLIMRNIVADLNGWNGNEHKGYQNDKFYMH